MSDVERQADLFSDLAYYELLAEMALGHNPDLWEHEQFVMAGRLAIFGDEL